VIVGCVPNVQYSLWVIQRCGEKIAVEIGLDAFVHIIQPKTCQDRVELGLLPVSEEHPRRDIPLSFGRVVL